MQPVLMTRSKRRKKASPQKFKSIGRRRVIGILKMAVPCRSIVATSAHAKAGIPKPETAQRAFFSGGLKTCLLTFFVLEFVYAITKLG